MQKMNDQVIYSALCNTYVKLDYTLLLHPERKEDLINITTKLAEEFGAEKTIICLAEMFDDSKLIIGYLFKYPECCNYFHQLLKINNYFLTT